MSTNRASCAPRRCHISHTSSLGPHASTRGAIPVQKMGEDLCSRGGKAGRGARSIRAVQGVHGPRADLGTRLEGSAHGLVKYTHESRGAPGRGRGAHPGNRDCDRDTQRGAGTHGTRTRGPRSSGRLPWAVPPPAGGERLRGAGTGEIPEPAPGRDPRPPPVTKGRGHGAMQGGRRG